MSDSPIRCIVGLGNIGREYARTRHNAGFEVLNRLATDDSILIQPPTELYHWASGRLGTREACFLVWPRTYVNRSGGAVVNFMKANNLSPEGLLVLVDDFHLELGRLRFRKSGSDGGHNGLASLIEELGSEQFARLRLGIGPKPDSDGIVDFVLSRFESDQIEAAQKMFDIAAQAVIFALAHGVENAMGQYN